MTTRTDARPASGSKSNSNSKSKAKPPAAGRAATESTEETDTEKASRLGDARARMYRDLVFESAECVFGQKGFESTTMQDIANEAGVSLKTLYASYSGKKELYKDIQRVRGKAFIEGVLVAAAMGHTPLEKLALTVRSHMDFLLSHRDWLSFRLRTRVSWGIKPDDELAAEYWLLGLNNLREILQAGMDEGTFYEGQPVEIATMVQAVMQVAVTQKIEAEEHDVDHTSDDIMRHLVRLLCPDPKAALAHS